MAFQKTKDLEIVSEGRKVLDIAQGWANGGIHYLDDQLLNRPGRPLFSLVDYLWQETQDLQESNREAIVMISGFTTERDNELINEKSSRNF